MPNPLLAALAAAAALPAATPVTHADFGRTAHSPQAAQVADWVMAARDNGGQGFALIDKPRARLFVFDGDGRLRGDAPVLLGSARGDDTVPGIGNKPLAEVKPWEKTTPAGRFVGEHGRNMRGEDVVWIDYDAAVSMHPVLTTNPKERRLERLATPSVTDNRISYGCVNVPARFFHEVVIPALNAPHPMVYVLPDVKPLRVVFTGLARNENVARATAR